MTTIPKRRSVWLVICLDQEGHFNVYETYPSRKEADIGRDVIALDKEIIWAYVHEINLFQGEEEDDTEGDKS
jgi:hypothetical protein